MAKSRGNARSNQLTRNNARRAAIKKGIGNTRLGQRVARGSLTRGTLAGALLGARAKAASQGARLIRSSIRVGRAGPQRATVRGIGVRGRDLIKARGSAARGPGGIAIRRGGGGSSSDKS